MKKTRKLIPAFAMLLISAVLMSTASFAWFSMNRDVTANDISVSANTDSTYLLIATTLTGENDAEKLASIRTGGQTDVTFSDPAVALKPSAHNALGTQNGEISKTSDANTLTNWFTKNAAAPGASAADSSAAQPLSAFDGYVIRKTFYIAVAAGSKAGSNLLVSATFEAPASGKDNSAVTVLVTSPSAAVELSSTSTSSSTALVSSVPVDGYVTIDVYIYYDGENSAVYTNNADNLAGTKIDLTFTVS